MRRPPEKGRFGFLNAHILRTSSITDRSLTCENGVMGYFVYSFKIENHHNANFVATGGTAPQIVMTTTCGAITKSASWQLSVVIVSKNICHMPAWRFETVKYWWPGLSYVYSQKVNQCYRSWCGGSPGLHWPCLATTSHRGHVNNRPAIVAAEPAGLIM